MPLFTVMRRGEEPVSIEAENWIVAMGTGIAKLGGDVAIDRLACEMLSNGTVIARDVRTGTGYVILPSKGAEVKPKTEDAEAPMEAPEDDTFDELLDEANESDPSLDDMPEIDEQRARNQQLRDLIIEGRTDEAWALFDGWVAMGQGNGHTVATMLRACKNSAQQRDLLRMLTNCNYLEYTYLDAASEQHTASLAQLRQLGREAL